MGPSEVMELEDDDEDDDEDDAVAAGKERVRNGLAPAEVVGPDDDEVEEELDDDNGRSTSLANVKDSDKGESNKGNWVPPIVAMVDGAGGMCIGGKMVPPIAARGGGGGGSRTCIGAAGICIG